MQNVPPCLCIEPGVRGVAPLGGGGDTLQLACSWTMRMIADAARADSTAGAMSDRTTHARGLEQCTRWLRY